VGRPEVFQASAAAVRWKVHVWFVARIWRRNFAQRNVRGEASMDTLSLFGLFAVTAMLVAYALEDRSH